MPRNFSNLFAIHFSTRWYIILTFICWRMVERKHFRNDGLVANSRLSSSSCNTLSFICINCYVNCPTWNKTKKHFQGILKRWSVFRPPWVVCRRFKVSSSDFLLGYRRYADRHRRGTRGDVIPLPYDTPWPFGIRHASYGTRHLRN